MAILCPSKEPSPIAIKAREAGFKGLILPNKMPKKWLVNNLEVLGVENIQEVIGF